jgi:hypothetical protein
MASAAQVRDFAAGGRVGSIFRHRRGDLHDEVRRVLTKGKLPTSERIEVVTTAQEVGLRSSSSMMYGHVDTPKHWREGAEAAGETRAPSTG